MIRRLFILALAGGACLSQGAVFELKLLEAEQKTLRSNHRLKAYDADAEAAKEGANAQFATLLPKLSIQGSYQYQAQIPTVTFPGFPPIPFGTNSTYSIGPNLNYTLWDTFSGQKSYRSSSLLAEARAEDRKGAELQLLYNVRAAYVQVQLGLEELRLINDSLDLARAQQRDVDTRFRAGAAARLDVVTAQRQVLSYEIQFKQRQAELGSEFKDLLALLRDETVKDISEPGPPDIKDVSLVIKLDGLDESLAAFAHQEVPSPDDQQPQIRSLDLQARSAEEAAASQTAKLFPTIQVSAGIAQMRPYMPDPTDFLQETVGVTLSLPLYFGDPSPSQAAQQRSQALAADFRKAQLKEDIDRDFTKARALLESLRGQQKLAIEDVHQSEVAAELYYTSYRAGKVNLIDVQNSNLQALQSKVNAARIDAQILNQIVLLKSLSGKELCHD
jgi:outer membrane protein